MRSFFDFFWPGAVQALCMACFSPLPRSILARAEAAWRVFVSVVWVSFHLPCLFKRWVSIYRTPSFLFPPLLFPSTAMADPIFGGFDLNVQIEEDDDSNLPFDLNEPILEDHNNNGNVSVVTQFVVSFF
jgi:hypothetical protein